MRIAIEATIAQRGMLTGFGHYVVNILRALGRVAPEHEYLLMHSNEEWIGPDFGPQFAPVSYYVDKPPLNVLMHLNTVLKRSKADLFHATCTTGVPPDPPIPCVSTIHDVYPLLYPHEAFTPPSSFYRLLVKLSVDNSVHIFTNSNFTADELTKEFGVERSRMTTTYPSLALPESKLSWPVRPKDGYLLCVGAIERRKGQLLLLEAYRRAFEKRGFAPDLLFIGPDRGDGEQLEKTIEAYGLKRKISWQRYVSDAALAAYYRSASFFAFTSTYEGFGVPLIEAMAAGIPTLCTDIPVFHEIAGSYPLFGKPEPRDLGEKLIELLDGKHDAHFASAPRLKYSWDECAKGIATGYKSLLG